MDGKAKRRWLRFSVRTLLVAITILCVWLGWQVSIVRYRRTAREKIEASGGNLLDGLGGNIVLRRDGHPLQSINWVRRMIGEEKVWVVWFPRTATNDDLTTAAAFPEAAVYDSLPQFAKPRR